MTRVEHSGFGGECERPSYILAKHLHMSSRTISTQIDLKKNWLSRHYNPSLCKLTCDSNIEFYNTNDIECKTENLNMTIETLRLMDFDEQSSDDICVNEIVIKTLNLQNSLKNLMLNIDTIDMDNHTLTQWQNVIESILKKEHFYQLENVIILLRIPSLDMDCNWILKMLKQNVQLLKYQFKQFIIGWTVDHVKCYVLEWNKDVDTKYLDEFKALCYQNDTKQEAQQQMKQKYSLLMRKWST